MLIFLSSNQLESKFKMQACCCLTELTKYKTKWSKYIECLLSFHHKENEKNNVNPYHFILYSFDTLQVILSWSWPCNLTHTFSSSFSESAIGMSLNRVWGLAAAPGLPAPLSQPACTRLDLETQPPTQKAVSHDPLWWLNCPIQNVFFLWKRKKEHYLSLLKYCDLCSLLTIACWIDNDLCWLMTIAYCYGNDFCTFYIWLLYRMLLVALLSLTTAFH